LLDRKGDLALYDAVNAHSPFFRNVLGDPGNGTMIANKVKLDMLTASKSEESFASLLKGCFPVSRTRSGFWRVVRERAFVASQGSALF
jgi:hypothetical protein